MAIDLSLYEIILAPIISDKAYKLNKSLNQLTLKVHPLVNKPMVKEAIEKLFSVKVKRVNMINRAGKHRRVRGHKTQSSAQKKAIVTLAEGYKLDLFDQAGAHTAADISKAEKQKK